MLSYSILHDNCHVTAKSCNYEYEQLRKDGVPN